MSRIMVRVGGSSKRIIMNTYFIHKTHSTKNLPTIKDGYLEADRSRTWIMVVTKKSRDEVEKDYSEYVVGIAMT